MDQFGLRIKLYIANCHKHRLDPEDDHFANNSEYEGDPQTHASSYNYLSYNSYIDDITAIAEDLEKTKCIGYSCLVVLLNTDCVCRSKMLRKVLKAIANNSHLQFKSKLLMATYTKKVQGDWNRDMSEVFFKKYFVNLRKYSVAYSQSSLLHPDLNKLYSNRYAEDKDNPFLDLQKIMRPKIFGSEDRENVKFNDDHIKNFTENDRNPMEDHCNFNRSKLGNAIFMQCFINKDSDRGIEIETLMFQAYRSPLKPIQEILKKNCRILGYFRIIQTSTRDPFHICSINPTLAIVINNYNYAKSVTKSKEDENREGSEEDENREGSEEDVKRLIREFKIAGIPYIIIQDCDGDRMLRLTKYLGALDCSALRTLLFFIMSHGGSNDTIHTPEGAEINLKEDIVKPIQSNSSLKEVETAIVVVACRGTTDPQYMDFKDRRKIQPTDSSYLLSNIVLMYNVPDTVMSCRCAKHGSPFMMSLCKQFRKFNELQKIAQHVEEDLREEAVYEGLKKISEFVSSDSHKSHHIEKVPGQATKVIRFIETLLNDLKTLDEYNRCEEDVGVSKPLFYVSGSLRPPNAHGKSFADKFFDPTLEADHCSQDNHTDLEQCRMECKEEEEYMD